MASSLFRQDIEASVMGLETAQRALSGQFTAAGMPVAVLHRVELVLEELVMNIIMHGLDDPTDQHIGLVAELAEDGCRLVVEDSGRPFDPTAVPLPPAALQPGEEASLGGLGLVLVRRMARDLRHERLPEGRNRLSLRVPNEPPAQG